MALGGRSDCPDSSAKTIHAFNPALGQIRAGGQVVDAQLVHLVTLEIDGASE